MPIDVNKYNKFLTEYAEELDISPSKYKQAVERYNAVANWLENGGYEGCSGELKIYPQGSFRLGTVTRPIIHGKEVDYDIDLVCELPIQKHITSPQNIKSLVGNRIKENAMYSRMLDKEGRRCWTLNYAEQDDIGFHMDILPCIPDGMKGTVTAIELTHKENNDEYTWSCSDPSGYAAWFDRRNREAFLLVEKTQRLNIFRRDSAIFASVDEVPAQLVKTPLQRAIQIMKRHRDIRFNGDDSSDFKPISMIITTLAAKLYQNEADVFSALNNIITKLHAHAGLVDNKMLLDSNVASLNLIQRLNDGTWYIANPVNPDENFADRWHENNHARARAFFKWVEWLKNDLIDILSSSNSQHVRRMLTEGLGAYTANKYFQDIWFVPPSPAENVQPRKVNITHSPRPWRKN